MIDRTTFFACVRRTLFGGRLTQGQVDGLSAILDEWEYLDLTDIRHLAYILATAYHEVDKTMLPIKEYGSDRYFFRLYDIQGGRPSLAYSLGNIKLGDGVRFAGRGLVPLVGRKNYARMSALVSCPRFGVDLAKDPDAALQLDLAVAILFEGMLDPCTNFGGLAGYALDDFFSVTKDDPVGARRIIGHDGAALVADYYRKFRSAILAASQAVAA